jgi:defect-in-organelle-trafficking protein DotC
MSRSIRYIAATAISLVFLTGCDPTPDDGDRGHYEAVREIALTYGAQSGLHWKAQQITAYLDLHSDELDKIFNFNALLMKHNVLPPVVAQYGKTYQIENDHTVRISDKELKMLKPARFVSVAPNWRDYIFIQYAAPEEPPENLLPSNGYEESLWREAIEIGWSVGVEQANAIFQNSLSILSQDFEGMVLYQILHAQNMISAPYTETTNLGVTGNTEGLRLNDKIITIEKPSVLNPQTQQWHPILYDENI